MFTEKYSTGPCEGKRSGRILRILDATSSSTLSHDGRCFRFGCPAGGLRPPYRRFHHSPTQHDNTTDIYIKGDNNDGQANYYNDSNTIGGFATASYGPNRFERLGSVRGSSDGGQFSEKSTPNDVWQFHDSFLRLVYNNDRTNHDDHHGQNDNDKCAD